GWLTPMSSPTSCTDFSSPTTGSGISERTEGVCDRSTTSDPSGRRVSRPAISRRCGRSTTAERRPPANCYDDDFMKRLKRMIWLLALVPAVIVFGVSCKKAPDGAAPPAPAAATVPAGAAPSGAAPGVPTASGAPASPAAIKPMPAQIPDVLARVNDEKIERWEFENALKRIEARAGGPVPPEKRD